MTASQWLDEPPPVAPDEQLWRQRPRDEPATQTRTDVHGRMVSGGAFIFDAPAETPAVWGSGAEVAWAEGEPFMITGPPGVGKTTLGGQLVAGRCGFVDDVLGMSVRPGRRVLYLACDRPKQIARALHRQFRHFTRDAINDRLVVWKGPPAADLARNPLHLLELVRSAEADTVVIDSAKDVAIKLSDDEAGQGFNQAIQHCIAENVEVMIYHHQTKRGGGGAGKPNTLADVYGSAWLTAGMGSVMLLWGAAGDPIVELIHLKQPAEPIGPLRISHDHTTGTSTIAAGLNLLDLLCRKPLTAREVAAALYGEPTDANVAKARRKLDKHVADGQAVALDDTDRGGSGGGSHGRRYGARDHTQKATDETTDGLFSAQPTDTTDTRPTQTGETAGQATDAPTDATDAPSDRRAAPSLEMAASFVAPPCTVCQQPMSTVDDGQTTHPGCDQ